MARLHPVPLRARRNGWTPERQRAFIDQLARCGVVSAAAKAVGMTPKSAYRLRDRPEAGSFAAAWDAAARRGLDASAALAIKRAVDGVVEPVFRGDRQIGGRRRYNDRLLMAAMRRMGPPPFTRAGRHCARRRARRAQGSAGPAGATALA